MSERMTFAVEEKGKIMDDLIKRQDAIDAIYHHIPDKTMDECRMMLHEVPSATKGEKECG